MVRGTAAGALFVLGLAAACTSTSGLAGPKEEPDASGADATISEPDGKEQAVVAIQPPTVDITRAAFEIGVVNGINGSTSEWKIHFDNVVCDVQ